MRAGLKNQWIFFFALFLSLFLSLFSLSFSFSHIQPHNTNVHRFVFLLSKKMSLFVFLFLYAIQYFFLSSCSLLIRLSFLFSILLWLLFIVCLTSFFFSFLLCISLRRKSSLRKKLSSKDKSHQRAEDRKRNEHLMYAQRNIQRLMLQAQVEKEHKRRIREKGKPIGMGVPDRD